MKKILLVLAFASSLACITSCSSFSGPESVAKQAVKALQKGDYDSYAATFNLSSSDQKMLAGMAEEKISDDISGKGGIKSFKISSSEVSGDEARVKVHLTFKDSSESDETMYFVKVDGKWKQELNK